MLLTLFIFSIQGHAANLQKIQPKTSSINHNIPSNPSRGGLQHIREFTASAYDLSYQSCGKHPGDPSYGVTRYGINLVGKTREEAMAVAVDPNIIPLGSKIQIIFPGRPEYNGIYTAVDTGSFQGRHIDLFFGDFNSPYPSDQALQFGRTTAKIIILATPYAF